MQHSLRRLFKWLGYLALGCYVALAVGILGIRYWVLPNINQWREPLQRELSRFLPVQLELGEIHAEWRGRNPSLSLRDTTLRDADGRPLLNIPSLEAILAWPSVFSGTPRFLALHTDGVELTLRRDAQERISLVGFEVESPGNGHSRAESDGGLLQWLSQQSNVRLSHSRIVWLDERRRAPPLELMDVSLGFGAEGGHHVFSLHAQPPPALGASFALQGRVRALTQETQSVSLAQLSGLFYMSIDDMRPAGWAPWLDFHNVMERGRLSWQGWQELTEGVPRHHVSQLNVQGGVWNPSEGVRVAADSAQVYLAGNWQALQRIFPAQGGTPAGSVPLSPHDEPFPSVRVATRLSGLALDVAGQFETPLTFDEIAVSASLSQRLQGGLLLRFDQAQLRNADMDLSLQGDWSQYGAGAAGLIDMQGHFHRAELAAIVRYLPAEVDDDARNWLRHGLLAGRILDAPLRIQGDLARFPFGDDPSEGDFLVGGRVQDAVIDYAPASVIGPPGWPRLEKLNGRAQLHRVDLTIHADSMQMQPAGLPITLRDVSARIPNIDHGSVLDVAGIGQADAAAFLALLKSTPLARMLDGLFDQAAGEGRWEVPIALTIPLMDVDASQVKGEIRFDKAGLRLDPGFPALSALTGVLAFTETQVQAEGMKGQALGGPVSISGGVGKGHKGLVFDGRLKAAALSEYLGDPLAAVLAGETAYRLALRRLGSGAYGMQLDSSLEGLGITLPEPLTKAAAQRWPLQATWTPAGKGDAALSIRLSDMSLRFLHRSGGQPGEPVFHSGAINLRGNVAPPEGGLGLDLKMHHIDIDAWRERAALFDGPAGISEKAGAKDAVRPVFPPVRDLRLQAGRARVAGVDLDQLTFTARRPQADRWRVDVSSTQTAGTVFWRERRGRIEGEVEAHFERLALGKESDGTPAPGKAGAGADDSPMLEDDIHFPAIRLKVDRLRLYGRHLGALSVVGVNETAGRSWKLEQLEVTSPHARLKGSGRWRLAGPRRGLTLQAQAMFDDLGAYLETAGFKDLMQGGHGEVKGTIEWRELPWRFERSGLQGDLEVDLVKGRFSSVGSRSSRLLELLSLQSVQRLTSLNWNPAGLMQQGFPFDALQGSIRVNDGVMHSENYRVTGPVATIVIAGDVDLPQESLDLYAMVAPNLDVSGAAIAAGIAVNPIVGVGAFLTQWLLKNPMSRAMAVEYRVKGDFDSPSVETVETAR